MTSEIRVSLKAFDSAVLDGSVKTVLSMLNESSKSFGASGFKIGGPIPLPTRKKRITLNRSVHVDKKSREHFGFEIHKRMIVLVLADGGYGLASELTKIVLPYGVSVRVKVC